MSFKVMHKLGEDKCLIVCIVPFCLQAYIEFQVARDCQESHAAVNGNSFSGHTILATFFPVEHFELKNFF